MIKSCKHTGSKLLTVDKKTLTGGSLCKKVIKFKSEPFHRGQ